MMKHLRILFTIAFLIAGLSVQAQTYSFPTVYSPASCASTYQITTTIRLDSVGVTNIYYDDGTNGSFAFEAFFTYENVFVNSNLPTGNFYTYSVTVYSDNPNLSSNNLSNNIGTVPLETHTAGGLASQNNPTYNGSASALGLSQGNYYSSPSLLNQLGYDSAALLINLPCMDTTVGRDTTFPLAIAWSQLSGENIGNQVVLNWQTFTEQNNMGFNIERSVNAVEWDVIGTLSSKAKNGNSNTPLNYNFRYNEMAAGTYYYRVIQKDADGKANVSNTVKMVIGNDNKDIEAFPNPAKNKLYLTGISNLAHFTIADLAGKIILKGRYFNYIDVSGLKPGMYLLKCGEKNTKLMIQY